jgi:hypothetical protein
MSTVTSLTIALSTNNSFIFCHLFNEDGEGPMELFKGEQSITFGYNNLAKGVFTYLLQRSMILFEHLGSFHCIMPPYKEVHMGPVQPRMNYTCVRLISLGTQSKFLFQLPSTSQALVFPLKYRTWKVKTCLDQPNAR